MSCWVLSRFMNQKQKRFMNHFKLRGVVTQGILICPFFFFSYPMPIFSTSPISLTLLLWDVTSLIQPVHILTAHPHQGKPKKIKPKLRMCIFQQRSGGNGFCISGPDFCKELRKALERSIKCTPSQTERREIFTYMIQQQSKNQHKLEREKHHLGLRRLKSSFQLCHWSCCYSLEKVYSPRTPSFSGYKMESFEELVHVKTRVGRGLII